MAAVLADTTLAGGSPAKPFLTRALRHLEAQGPSFPLMLLAGAPLVLQLGMLHARAVGLGLAVMILIGLLDLLAARMARPRAAVAAPFRDGLATALLVAAAAGTAMVLDNGTPVLAVLFVAVRACGRHWAGRSTMVGAAMTVVAAACCVDMGALATGAASGGWLIPAAASLTAVLALAAPAPLRGAGPLAPGRVVRPSVGGRARECLLVLLLAACVAIHLALLGADARLRVLGSGAAFLAMPFLLLGLGRCLQLAWSRRAPSLRDPVLALAVLGWTAGLVLGPQALAALAASGLGR